MPRAEAAALLPLARGAPSIQHLGGRLPEQTRRGACASIPSRQSHRVAFASASSASSLGAGDDVSSAPHVDQSQLIGHSATLRASCRNRSRRRRLGRAGVRRDRQPSWRGPLPRTGSDREFLPDSGSAKDEREPDHCDSDRSGSIWVAEKSFRHMRLEDFDYLTSLSSFRAGEVMCRLPLYASPRARMSWHRAYWIFADCELSSVVSDSRATVAATAAPQRATARRAPNWHRCAAPARSKG